MFPRLAFQTARRALRAMLVSIPLIGLSFNALPGATAADMETLPVSPLVMQEQEKQAIRYLTTEWRDILMELDPTTKIDTAPDVGAFGQPQAYGIDVVAHDLGWEVSAIIPGSSAAIDGSLRVGDIIFSGSKDTFAKGMKLSAFDNTPFIENDDPAALRDLLAGKPGNELTLEVIPKGKKLSNLELRLGRFHYTPKLWIAYGNRGVFTAPNGVKSPMSVYLARGETLTAFILESNPANGSDPFVRMQIYRAGTMDELGPENRLLTYVWNGNGLRSVAIVSDDYGDEEYFAARWRYEGKKLRSADFKMASAPKAQRQAAYAKTLKAQVTNKQYTPNDRLILAYGGKALPGGNAAALRFFNPAGDGISIVSGRRPKGYTHFMQMLRLNWTLYDKRGGLRTSHNGFDRSYVPLGPLLQIKGDMKKGFPGTPKKFKYEKNAWYSAPVSTGSDDWPYSYYYYNKDAPFVMASCAVKSRQMRYSLSSDGIHTVSYDKGMAKKCGNGFRQGYATAPRSGVPYDITPAEINAGRKFWAYSWIHGKPGQRQRITGTILNPSADNRWVYLHGKGKMENFIGMSGERILQGIWRQGILYEGELLNPRASKVGATKRFYGRPLDLYHIAGHKMETTNGKGMKRQLPSWPTFTGYVQEDQISGNGGKAVRHIMGPNWIIQYTKDRKNWLRVQFPVRRTASNDTSGMITNSKVIILPGGTAVNDGKFSKSDYKDFKQEYMFSGGRNVGTFFEWDNRGRTPKERFGFYQRRKYYPGEDKSLTGNDRRKKLAEFNRISEVSSPIPRYPDVPAMLKRENKYFSHCQYLGVEITYRSKTQRVPKRVRFQCDEGTGKRTNLKTHVVPLFYGEDVLFFDYKGDKDRNGFAHGVARGLRTVDNKIRLYRWEHGWPVDIVDETLSHKATNMASIRGSIIDLTYQPIKYTGPADAEGFPHGVGATPLIVGEREDYASGSDVYFYEYEYSKSETAPLIVDKGKPVDVPQADLRRRNAERNLVSHRQSDANYERDRAQRQADQAARARAEREAEEAEKRERRAARQAASERRQAKSRAAAEARKQSWNSFVENNKQNARDFNRTTRQINRGTARAFDDMERQKQERTEAARRQAEAQRRAVQQRQSRQSIPAATPQQYGGSSDPASTGSAPPPGADAPMSDRARKILAEQEALAAQRQRTADRLNGKTDDRRDAARNQAAPASLPAVAETPAPDAAPQGREKAPSPYGRWSMLAREQTGKKCWQEWLSPNGYVTLSVCYRPDYSYYVIKNLTADQIDVCYDIAYGGGGGTTGCIPDLAPGRQMDFGCGGKCDPDQGGFRDAILTKMLFRDGTVAPCSSPKCQPMSSRPVLAKD